MGNSIRLSLLMISLLVLTACGGSSLTGIWVGSGTRLDTSGPISGSVTLTETDTSFTGTLSFSGSLNGTIQVGGTVSGGSLTFVQGISGTASVSGNTMTITANVPLEGGGSAPFTFTATKQ